jgi:Peptidase family M23
MRRFALLPVLLGTLIGAPPAAAWTWPVDGPVLRAFHFDGDPYGPGLHRGLDVGGPPGVPVRAPAGGTVSFAGTVPGGGRTVTIQTADGFAVTLLHLGALFVRPGASVAEAEPVAVLGSSGEPEHAGAYVHLGVRIAADPQGYVDPLGLLPAPGESAPPPLPPVEEGGVVEPGPAPPADIPAELPEPVADPLPADPALPVPVPLAPSAPPVFGDTGAPGMRVPDTSGATLDGVSGSPAAERPAGFVPLARAAGPAIPLRIALPVDHGGAAVRSDPVGAPVAADDPVDPPEPLTRPLGRTAPEPRAAVREDPSREEGGASLAPGFAAAALAALLGSWLAARRRRLVRRGARGWAPAQGAQAVVQRRNASSSGALEAEDPGERAGEAGAQRREGARHRACRRSEVEHPLARLWLEQVSHCRKPTARPGRLLDVRGGRSRHERRVVRGRRMGDRRKPHEVVTRSRR